MCSEYLSRAPRLICGGGIHYYIEAKILREGDVTQRNNGFDFFVKEIQRGTDIEKARKRTWNSYRVKVKYVLEKQKQNKKVVELEKEHLKVTVE